MTVVERRGRFGVKVWDYDAKRYRWVGTFDTEEEARAADRAAKSRWGGPIATVADWAEVWLDKYERPAAATRQSYRYAVHAIVKQIGTQPMEAVGRRQARSLAREWPRSVSRVARTMWADAVREEICTTNPWTNLRLETPRGRKDLEALTEDQVEELARIAALVHGPQYGVQASALVLVVGYVGIRPGELCGLQVRDLALNRCELSVRRAVDATGQLKAPKNGEERTVTVPPRAAQALSAIAGLRPADDFVFVSPRGKRLNKSSLHYIWRPIATGWEINGNPPIDLYDLRHAAATHFIERGVNSADVAVQLGHTDGGRLVERLYGHPSQDRARDRLKMAFAEGRAADERRRRGYRAEGAAESDA